MMIGCLGLALAFKQSSGLAAAYGIAVTGTMCISTLIYFYVTRYNWDWPAWKSLVPACIFMFFDLSYFGANLLKFVDGGWFAITVAAVLTLIMVTWRDGRALLAKRFADSQVPVEIILKDIQRYKLMRTHGTGAFLSVSPLGTPITMLHLLKHTDSLPQRVILMSIVSTNTPFVTRQERVAITNLGKGFYRLIASYGFMETPSIPEILDIATEQGLSLDTYSATFYVGRETLLSTGGGLMSGWRKGLFAYLSRNSWNVTTFFNIPANRVVELGSQVEL